MTKNRSLFIIAAVGCLLLIPFIAMQFTTEVNWNATDFLVAGGILLAAGFTTNFIWITLAKSKYRSLLLGVFVLLVLLLWVELAVGIFGSPIAGS